VHGVGSSGQEMVWAIVCSPTEAADIAIMFITPLYEIDFAEAHRSSQTVQAGPERPYLARARRK